MGRETVPALLQIIGAISLIILLMMSGIAPILVNSLPNKTGTARTTIVENISPLLVMFGSSEAEVAARDQLLQNFPNSYVRDFSISKQQIIEYTGPVIYIGHSFEEGISYRNQIVQWNSLSEIIGKSLSNNHYILGCNSQTISELTAETDKNVISFGQEVDAIAGANFISLKISIIHNMYKIVKLSFLSLLFNRMYQLTLDSDQFLPLRLGGEEVNTMGPLFFAMIGTLFPLTGAALALSAAMFTISMLNAATALYNLVSFVLDLTNGENPDASLLLNSMRIIISAYVAVLTNQILKLPWWRQATGFAALSADTAKNAIASVVVVLACAAALASLLYYMTKFTYDFVDSDTTYW